jgi:hypothetical protein
VQQCVEYRSPVKGLAAMRAPNCIRSNVAVRIVSISQEYFDRYGGDREMMLKHNRPCIVVVRLKFRGQRRDFAVPLRSNIAPNVPKDQYFPLPPRPTTKPNHRHGVHYIKMFPIEKKYQQRFRTDGSKYYENLQSILDANTKQIVSGKRQNWCV